MPASKAAAHGDTYPWFKEHVASVIGDPRRLSWSLEVHGAVAVLRRWCWLSPTTGVRLCDLTSVLRATKKQVQRMLPALLEHFTEESGELVDLDLREQKLALESQREQARAAAYAKHAKSGIAAIAMRSESDRSATREEKSRPDKSSITSKSEELNQIVAGIAARKHV